MLYLLSLLVSFCSLAAVIEGPLNTIDYAQNPSGIQWQKIDTANFELIFPKEVSDEAQRVAHLLEKVYPFVTRSLETKPPRISLILQNQATFSNGFVTLAPRRSELYLTPTVDPELSNTEWLKTLAIHEFRHVVQFQKSRKNFNRYYEFFLGQYGQALGIGLSFPPWFLEGDAVGIETALTRGGRGRLPLFERDLRTLLLSGREYDYDKAHLGSYEDYIPNHYVYGYFYTSFMRNQEGDLFLSKLGDEATDRSYNPLTFYNSYERLTGRSFEKFYRESLASLTKLWQEKLALIQPTPYEVKNLPQKSGWTNYLYPQPMGAGTYFALKKGLSHYDRFVLTDGKTETVVFYPGPLSNEYPYKVRNGRVAYLEQELDPRWGYRDYSRLKVFDLAKKAHVFDERGLKARLAVLNEAGDHVLYVLWNEKQEQYLVVTNLAGKDVYRLRYPSDRVITSLDWLGRDQVVMVVKGREDQKEVVKLTLLDQVEESILPPAYANYGFVTAAEGKIFLEAPTSGIDNVYVIAEGYLRQLTSSRFGAYAPAFAEGQLIYNEYSVDGMTIAVKKLPWDEVQVSQDSFAPVYEKFAQTENRDGFERDLFAQETYPAKTYSQLANAVNLHSWMILAPPLSSTVTLAGYSRDVLNKFALTFGAVYDINEQTTKGFVSSAWSHYYPVFDVRSAYGGRVQEIRRGGKGVEDEWEEGTLEVGAQVPWKYIQGRFLHAFTARAFAKLIKVENKIGTGLDDVNDGALFSPGGDVTYALTSRVSRRDINPEWGIRSFAHFEKGRDITGIAQTGALEAVDSVWFAPGFANHHSFFQQLAYEKQDGANYEYASLILKPRGTKNFFLEEFRKYSANYTAPLFYPDWHWSRYLYVKRLYANVFYDELTGRIGTFDYHAASTGWELMTEFNIVRLFIPLTIGVRGNYVLRGLEKQDSYEIFFITPTANF